MKTLLAALLIPVFVVPKAQSRILTSVLILLFVVAMNVFAQDSIPSGYVGRAVCGDDNKPKVLIESDSIGKSILPFLLIHEFNHADRIIGSGMGCNEWHEYLLKHLVQGHQYELDARCANVAYAMATDLRTYDVALRASIAQYYFVNWETYEKNGFYEIMFRDLCPEKRALAIIEQAKSENAGMDVTFVCYPSTKTCVVRKVE